MSTFRRVAETQSVPAYMEETIFPTQQPSLADDKWGDLRSRQAGNRAEIARETMGRASQGAPQEQRIRKTDWAAAQEPQRYENPTQTFGPNSYANADPRVANINPALAIRRSDTGFDQGMNSRPSPSDFGMDADIRFGNDSEVMASLMGHGSSIWNSDIPYMAERLAEENEDRHNKFSTDKSREDSQRSRRSQWETDRMSELAPRGKSMARAHTYVQRTASEEVVGNSFGQMPVQDLVDRERERLASLSDSRAQRMSIKRDHVSGRVKSKTWQERYNPYAQTLQSQTRSSMDWLTEDILGGY